MTTLLNTIADKWFTWQFAMLWQTAVLIAIIWTVDLAVRKWAHPQVRYALWMLVLVKLLIPPTFTSPASVTSHIPAVAQKAVSIQFNPAPQTHETKAATGMERISGAEKTAPINTAQTVNGTLAFSEGNTQRGALNADKAVEAAAPFLSWKVAAMFVWLAGIAVLSLWLIARLSGLRREHVKDTAFQLPERFGEQLQAAAQKLNLKRLPAVVLTDKVACPAVFGVFRPVLLMPAEKFKTMSARDTEHILLHELAHIKRGDLLVHAVYMTLQIAYWFNPLLWMIRRTLQNLRGLCCDATVAKLLREDTVHYRQTLLETARQLLAEPVDPGLGLLGLFENSNWLVTRLKWLEKNTWKNRPLRIATIVVLIAIMTTCVLPMANKRKPEVSSQKSKYIATLDNGVTVELVGICEYPSKGKQWWRPDGSPFNIDFYTQSKGTISSDGAPYEIAVKLNGPDDLDFTWRQVKGTRGSSSLYVRDKKDNYLNNIKASRFNIDKNLKSTRVEIGVAAGQWATRFKHQGMGTMSSSRGKHGIAFSKAYQIDNNIEITVSDDYFETDYRLVAVGKNGDVHATNNRNSNSAGKVRQSTFTFINLNLDQIKEFQFQTRSYEWVTFKDVALRPKEDKQETKAASASDPMNQSSTVPYNTVIERQLQAGRELGGFDSDLFDFKTNTIFEFPDKVKFWDVPNWMANRGIDVICVNSEDGPTLTGNGKVQNSGGNICKFIATDSGMDCSYSNLIKAWQEEDSREIIDYDGWDNLPCRFFFRSRSDDCGIIEITHVNDHEQTITFKYKLFETTQNTELKTKNYTATLPNGITVELVGVCEFPNDKQWWSPAGEALDEAVFNECWLTLKGDPLIDGHTKYAFAIKWPFEEGGRLNSIFKLDKSNASVYRPIGDDNKVDLTSIYVLDIPTDQESMNFEIDVDMSLLQMTPEEFAVNRKGKGEYKTVTFKNVSLRPGVKTKVEIESRSSAASPQSLEKKTEASGKLEFRIVAQLTTEQAKEVNWPQANQEGIEWIPIKNKENNDQQWPWYTDLPVRKIKNTNYLLVGNRSNEIMLADGSWGLQKVYPRADAMGRSAIGFDFDEKGAELFYDLTSHHIGKRLAIIVDGIVQNAPQINSAVRGHGIITGQFSESEVEKLVEMLSVGMPPVVPLAQGQQPGFGPTIEITINDAVSVKSNSLIDFDTGELFTLPDNWLERTPEETMQWLIETGIDASGASRDTIKGLMCEDMVFASMNNSYWNNVKPDLLATNNLWEVGKPGRPAYMTGKGELPATYIFKTREGGIGVLQITGFNENPRGIKIRYKMLQNYDKNVSLRPGVKTEE